jgi:trans-aconitate 2-methyltransferase
MTDTWNPSQYDRFQREREQPFYDLVSMLRPAQSMRTVDLGCGTGKLTRELHSTLNAGETLGVDKSARMLDNASAEATTGLRFERGDIETFVLTARGFDLVFSNAALHWVDDHETLIGRLAAALRPGGQLAFQIPAQHDGVSHVTADELAMTEPYRSAFGGWRRAQPVLSPEAYARLLYRYGFGEQNVRLIVYPHVLAGPEEAVEWVKGTLLTEYERHLPPDMFERFVAAYRERLIARLGPARPCFFPYKRILAWGQRA